MKVLITILFVLLCLASFSKPQNRCISFASDGNYCASCYKSTSSYPQQGCHAPPKTPNCLVETYSKGRGGGCNLCETGYVLTAVVFSFSVHVSCKPNAPDGNCLYWKTQSPADGTLNCIACKEGFYSITKGLEKPSKCVAASSLKGTVENCELGGNNLDGFCLTCFKCKPGYALAHDGHKCLRSFVPGCLYSTFDGKTCLGCDYFDGY